MIRFFVRNSVFVNPLMLVILGAGILAYATITRRLKWRGSEVLELAAQAVPARTASATCTAAITARTEG